MPDQYIEDATYGPEDNKLRITAFDRLSADLYDRVKEAGYRWAPKQGLFFATWSPSREDIALELCGSIDDEDTTLVARAEERADRFEDYSDSRKRDTESASAAVKTWPMASLLVSLSWLATILRNEHAGPRRRSGAAWTRPSRCGTRPSIGRIEQPVLSGTRSISNARTSEHAVSRSWKLNTGNRHVSMTVRNTS